MAAMLAGVAYALEAIVFAVSPGGTLQAVVSLVAVLLTAAGLVGFHALQKEGYGRIGRVGFYTAVMGALVQAVAVLASLLSGAGTSKGHLPSCCSR